jgi:hypothetical protein
MPYEGPDRRRHRVYVTRNTEYHLRDNVCVAVRDRKSGAFRDAHIALQLKLEGVVKIYSNGAALPHFCEPGVGDAIYFNDRRDDGDERQIVTSRLESIDRPSKAVVMRYPS